MGCLLKIRIGYVSLESGGGRLGIGIYSLEALDVAPSLGTVGLPLIFATRQVTVSSNSPQVQSAYLFTFFCLAFCEAHCSPEV